MKSIWLVIVLITGLLFGGALSLLQAQQTPLSGVFFMQENGAHLHLLSSGTFYIVVERKNTGGGRFTVDGATLTLRYLSAARTAILRIQGDKLYADNGQVWVRSDVGASVSQSEQSPTNPASPPAAKMTNNEVIQLVSAGLSERAVATSIRQASNKDFDLTPTGLIALKKAGVSDAVIAAMQESGMPTPASAAANQVTPASRSEASPEPPRTIGTPPASPCADIDYLGVIQAVTGGGQMAGRNAYGGRVRNRALYTKEVDFAWFMNGRAETGTFRIPAGQFIDVNLGQGSGMPTNVRVVNCR